MPDLQNATIRDVDCETCDGTGHIEINTESETRRGGTTKRIDCETCDGKGLVPESPQRFVKRLAQENHLDRDSLQLMAINLLKYIEYEAGREDQDARRIILEQATEFSKR